jgi:hypothetical protein
MSAAHKFNLLAVVVAAGTETWAAAVRLRQVRLAVEVALLIQQA